MKRSLMKSINKVLLTIFFVFGFSVLNFAQTEQDRRVAPKNPPQVRPGQKKDEKKNKEDNDQNQGTPEKSPEPKKRNPRDGE